MPRKRSIRDRATLTPSLDTTTIELIIAQHVTKTLASYEANMNNTLEKNGIGSNSGVPKA